MDHFELVSEYKPTGDQPQAIAELVERVQGRQSMPDFTRGYGFWKDFYDGKCDSAIDRSRHLIIAHNKTLAAQLIRRVQGDVPR